MSTESKPSDEQLIDRFCRLSRETERAFDAGTLTEEDWRAALAEGRELLEQSGYPKARSMLHCLIDCYPGEWIQRAFPRDAS